MLILTPSAFSLTSAAAPSATLDWARSALGQRVDEHGTSAAGLLPADDDVVLVLPPQAVSWHHIHLPKVPTAKLRAVLDGLLEERLLNDSPELHFALQPGARAGQAVWVAACHKIWLRGWLQALDAAGHPVARIVPAFWPLSSDTNQTTESGGALHWAHLQSGQAWLASASATGVSCMPLAAAGTHTDSLHPVANADAPPPRWMAEPAAIAQAEQQLDQRFELMPQPEWLLRCAQSAWNLAQFDMRLSNATRRNQRWRQTWREWRSAPAWRPARWGLGALVVVQLLGLNAAAWQERQLLQQKQAAVPQTLKQVFPNVGLVLDAPVQMRRELATLRQAGGQLATSDLEAMLSALALVSGEQPLLVDKIRYDGQRAYFDAGPAAEAQWPALQEALQRNGWRVQREGNEMSLTPEQP